MDVLQALLAAIASDPGDEVPWFGLADWHEEQDDPRRAELIRLSVRLRRPDLDHPERPFLEAQLRALAAQGITVPLPRRRLSLAPGVALDLVLVPPGWFLMGSPPDEVRRDLDEGPIHPVHLPRGLWLGVHQVTQAQWQAVMERDPPGRFRGPQRPVDGISWREGSLFLAHLKARFGLNARFPTEAEWEYACRGLTTTPFSFGAIVSSELANFDGNYPYGPAPVGPWLECTSPVGSYPPNAWGLYDMHGNLWEWCADWFDEAYYQHSPIESPTGPATGALRVLRGGSWYSYSWSCRSAGRERFSPESGAGNYGLRIAMDVGG